MGVWLYGLIAGVSYGIQTRRRANESENRALKAEAALVSARLEALRSRLNPHFLFNALHTVGALVRQDAALAESAVEKLGDILRQSLRDDSGETVPSARSGSSPAVPGFEQLRYGDRLAVSSEIDPRALACPTPTFALQTLVENAVRHSIANRVEGGRVEITARVEGATSSSGCRDDGPGRRRTPTAAPGTGCARWRSASPRSTEAPHRWRSTPRAAKGYEVSSGCLPAIATRDLSRMRKAVVVIADDEPLARRRCAVAWLLDWIGDVHEAGDGLSAIRAVDDLRPHILFLDVVMPGVSGVEVAEQIAHRPYIVFTTAFERFAVTAFEIGALDFLLKPFGRDRVRGGRAGPPGNCARHALRRGAGARGAGRGAADPSVFVRERGRMVAVPLEGVERLEACDDYVTLHAGGRSTWCTPACRTWRRDWSPAASCGSTGPTS